MNIFKQMFNVSLQGNGDIEKMGKKAFPFLKETYVTARTCQKNGHLEIISTIM